MDIPPLEVGTEEGGFLIDGLAFLDAVPTFGHLQNAGVGDGGLEFLLQVLDDVFPAGFVPGDGEGVGGGGRGGRGGCCCYCYCCCSCSWCYEGVGGGERGGGGGGGRHAIGGGGGGGC